MKKSNLAELHKELGGIFLEGNLSQIPNYYDNPDNEIIHIRNSSGIVDLSGRGKLTISGKDHLKLLQGMLTNDMVKLEVGKGNHAVALTVKGRMLADMRAFKFPDFMLFDTEPGLQTVLAEHLKKFKLSYKADIKDSTNDYLHFHICGPKSTDFVESEFQLSFSEFSEYDYKIIHINNAEIFLIKINRTGETGFDLITESGEAGKLFRDLLSKGEVAGLKPFGINALNTMRIEAGIPLFGIDMDDSTIPIEAGLWDALDFEKGCYIGQEVIARIKWRGRVNWHLTGLETTDNAVFAVGSKIFNGDKEIGRITSATFSKTLGKNIALGYIRREFREEGQAVLIKSGENSYLNAIVCDLPFINNFN